MDYQFREKSKFALLAVNNVYTDLPTSVFQFCDGTWIMPGVPVQDSASGKSGWDPSAWNALGALI